MTVRFGARDVRERVKSRACLPLVVRFFYVGSRGINFGAARQIISARSRAPSEPREVSRSPVPFEIRIPRRVRAPGTARAPVISRNFAIANPRVWKRSRRQCSRVTSSDVSARDDEGVVEGGGGSNDRS